MMTYDLDEVVKFDNKDMTLFTAVRRIAEARAGEQLNPELTIFRELGSQPPEFGVDDIERIAETDEYKAELRRRKAEGS